MKTTRTLNKKSKVTFPPKKPNCFEQILIILKDKPTLRAAYILSPNGDSIRFDEIGGKIIQEEY